MPASSLLWIRKADCILELSRGVNVFTGFFERLGYKLCENSLKSTETTDLQTPLLSRVVILLDILASSGKPRGPRPPEPLKMSILSPPLPMLCETQTIFFLIPVKVLKFMLGAFCPSKTDFFGNYLNFFWLVWLSAEAKVAPPLPGPTLDRLMKT